MASYSKEKQQSVKDVIDKYTDNTLDTYTRAAIKDKAVAEMEKGASATEVADAVFDYINKYHSGDVYEAAMCSQICPTPVLYVLRNDIRKILK